MNHMLKGFWVLLLSFIFLFPALGEENKQKIIPLSSEAYKLLEIIYITQGLGLPSKAYPYSADEFEKALHRLQLKDLPDAAKKAYERIKAILKPRKLYKEDRMMAFNADGTFSFESYLHTDTNTTDWEHGYEKRTPLISFNLEMWFFEGIYGKFGAFFKEEYRAINEDKTNFSNIPTSPMYLDWGFPQSAYISWGGPHWNFQIGRDKLSWGNGLTGNTMLSDYTDYYDFFRATTYWDNFKFSTVYIALEPWMTPEEEASQTGGWYPLYGELYKAFFGHRFEFRILDKINLALSESVIFGNKYPELRDFNPIMIFHNWSIPERANSMFTAEIDITPYKWLNLYGQYTIDDFQTSYEIEEGAGGRPGAGAYLFGGRLFFPIGPGFIEGAAEYVHTDPWLYNRWHPLTKYTSRRRIWSFIPPDQYEWVDKPLGYHLGPDANVIYGSLGYSIPGFITLSGDITFSDTSEMSINTTYQLGVTDLTPLRGVIEGKQIVHFYAGVSPLDFVLVESDIYFVNVRNNHHVLGAEKNDLEWIFTLSLKL